MITALDKLGLYITWEQFFLLYRALFGILVFWHLMYSVPEISSLHGKFTTSVGPLRGHIYLFIYLFAYLLYFIDDAVPHALS
jgi:hypothetical protein